MRAAARARASAAALARRGGVLTADVRVARDRGLTAVQLVLERDGAPLARGFRRLQKRAGVRVQMRERATVPTRRLRAARDHD